MSSSNKDGKQTDNMKSLKQQASDCAPGCACHGTGSSGRLRWVLGVIVLLVAGTLAARAVIKTNAAPSQPDAAAFISPTAVQTPAEGAGAIPADETAKATDSFVAPELGALTDLNTVAMATTAVFIYVPGKDGSSGNAPAAAMTSAISRIGTAGYKVGLYTLKFGTRDYEAIAEQMPVPGVLTVFKGRGMSAVSGDVTETKLIQAFVAASSAGGCGPSGCGPAGCK